MKLNIHYDDAGRIVSVAALNPDVAHIGVKTTGALSIAVVDAEEVKHPGHFAKLIKQYRIEPATSRLVSVARK